MSSWIQHPITLELIPRHEYVRPKEVSHFIFGDIESFVSPIDKTVISDRRQYEEHCKKHGVVNAAEFSPEYYARKAQERENFFKGKIPSEERFKRRQAINEIIERYERM